MNNNIKIISGILFFSVFIMLISCQKQNADWKGTIEEEDGVTVIKNPEEPLYGDLIFQLEEDLSIGNENDDNYYFPRGAWLNVDDGGNIYVADFGNIRIQKYDNTGKYLQTIGRKGQGPGEFQFPSNVLFDGEGNPCVFDARALHLFDKDGMFRKKIPLKAFLNNPYMSSNGFIFGTKRSTFEPGGPKESLIKLDSEGNVIQAVAEFEGEIKKSQNVIAWHRYSNRLGFSPITSNSFCYAYSSDYKIYVADADGKTSLIIEKAEMRHPITSKEKDFIKEEGPYAAVWRSKNAKPEEGIVFPPHRPFFGRLLADDRGRIYVMRVKPALDNSPDKEWDIFSKDGYYIYKMKLSFIPVVIKNASVYEVRENKETGDIKIVRHKIKNWDQIKTGI